MLSAEEIGVSLGEDADMTIDLGMFADVDLAVSLNLDSGEFDFELNKFAFETNGTLEDILLEASLGPLEVAIGNEDAEMGSASVSMAGEVKLINGALEFVPGENNLDVRLPVYGELAGIDLSGLGTPLIQLVGPMYDLDTSEAKIEVVSENLDRFFNLGEFDVGQVIQTVRDVIVVLDSVSDSEPMTTEIPFLNLEMGDFWILLRRWMIRFCLN